MSVPFKIIIVDDGFLGKYIERELSTHPVGVGQETKRLLPADYASALMADAVIDATGVVSEFPGGCLSISIGRNPSDKARLRLSLPAVAGTGMRGELLEMARGINAGWYFNVDGDQSRVTVVHAVSVASAVRLALKSGEYTGDWLLTDGVDPLRREVAIALAERLGQKRVYSLSMKWHKVLARLGDMLPFLPYSSDRLRIMTSDALRIGRSFSSICADWQPVDTVNYLKTHDYTDEDF